MTAPDWRTDADVQRCKLAFDEAMAHSRANQETFGEREANPALRQAYDAWMAARARAGDRFAQRVVSRNKGG